MQITAKQLYRLFDFLTWIKQKFRSLIVSNTNPGVFSESIFSIFLQAEISKGFASALVLLYTQGRSTSNLHFSINRCLALSLLFKDRSLSTGMWVTRALSQREWWCSTGTDLQMMMKNLMRSSGCGAVLLWSCPDMWRALCHSWVLRNTSTSLGRRGTSALHSSSLQTKRCLFCFAFCLFCCCFFALIFVCFVFLLLFVLLSFFVSF